MNGATASGQVPAGELHLGDLDDHLAGRVLLDGLVRGGDPAQREAQPRQPGLLLRPELLGG